MFIKHILNRLPSIIEGRVNCVVFKEYFHKSAATLKSVDDRRQMRASMPAKDEGTAGERTFDIDSLISK